MEISQWLKFFWSQNVYHVGHIAQTHSILNTVANVPTIGQSQEKSAIIATKSDQEIFMCSLPNSSI